MEQEAVGQDFEMYVRFLAEYQMMGDMEGKEFMTLQLSSEMAREENSRGNESRLRAQYPPCGPSHSSRGIAAR